MIGYAIDVSHHNPPDRLPWDKFAGHVDAVIVRVSYGAELRDRHAWAHVQRARAIGARVGYYHFFRPSQPVQKQWDVLRTQLEGLYVHEGDIVPAIDIELDPLPKPCTAWSPAAPSADGTGNEDAEAAGVPCHPSGTGRLPPHRRRYPAWDASRTAPHHTTAQTG